MVLHLTAQRRGKLVSFLRRELGLSSSLVKRLKWRGAFLVNGETAHTDRMVEVGEEITVVLSEDAPDYPAEDGALDILYEDDAILALDKPAVGGHGQHGADRDAGQQHEFGHQEEQPEQNEQYDIEEVHKAIR